MLMNREPPTYQNLLSPACLQGLGASSHHQLPNATCPLLPQVSYSPLPSLPQNPKAARVLSRWAVSSPRLTHLKFLEYVLISFVESPNSQPRQTVLSVAKWSPGFIPWVFIYVDRGLLRSIPVEAPEAPLLQMWSVYVPCNKTPGTQQKAELKRNTEACENWWHLPAPATTTPHTPTIPHPWLRQSRESPGKSKPSVVMLWKIWTLAIMWPKWLSDALPTVETTLRGVT